MGRFWTATLAAAATLCASPVGAVIITIEITGHVTSVSDVNGSVGAVDKYKDLTGAAFDLTYTFHTDKGSFRPFGPDHVVLAGGPEGAYFGPTNDLESPGAASITIAGNNLSLSESAYFGILPLHVLYVGDQGVDANAVSILINNPSLLPQTFGAPFSGDPCAGASQCSGAVLIGGGQTPKGVLWLRLETYELSYDGPFVQPDFVPEPATWAMLVVGFGAIGSLLRRRRPVSVISAQSSGSPAPCASRVPALDG